MCRPLTDSTRASSSGWRKRLAPLCCFLLCWLLRGAGDDRVNDAVPEVPRGWPKKLVVETEAGWFCAGEAGPEDALALVDEAAGGGFEDMMRPTQGMRADDGTRAQADGMASERGKEDQTANGRGRRGRGRGMEMGSICARLLDYAGVWVPQRDGLEGCVWVAARAG